jgi:hypothetical protein
MCTISASSNLQPALIVIFSAGSIPGTDSHDYQYQVINVGSKPATDGDFELTLMRVSLEVKAL